MLTSMITIPIEEAVCTTLRIRQGAVIVPTGTRPVMETPTIGQATTITTDKLSSGEYCFIPDCSSL